MKNEFYFWTQKLSENDCNFAYYNGFITEEKKREDVLRKITDENELSFRVYIGKNIKCFVNLNYIILYIYPREKDDHKRKVPIVSIFNLNMDCFDITEEVLFFCDKTNRSIDDDTIIDIFWAINKSKEISKSPSFNIKIRAIILINKTNNIKKNIISRFT